MIVYVCYCDLGYDGMTEPEMVFKTERDAQIWVSTQGGEGTYKQLEVLDKFLLPNEIQSNGDVK